MSTTNTQAYRVGLFVLGGLGLILSGVLLFGASKVFRSTIPMETYLDESVQGLDVGSPVKHRGVQIGTVADIEFVYNTYSDEAKLEGNQLTRARYIVVKMDIRRKIFEGRDDQQIKDLVKHLVDQGLRVRLAAQGFTGTSYVEIDYLNPTENPPLPIDWMPDALYIPSAPSTVAKFSNYIEQALKQFQQIRLDEVTSEAVGLLQDLRQTNADIRGLINRPDVQQAPADAAAAMASARALFESAEASVVPFMDALSPATASIRDLTKTLNDVVASGMVDEAARNVHTASENMLSASERLPAIANRADRAMRRLDGMVAKGDEDFRLTLENMASATRNLRTITEDAKVYPSNVLLGTPPARQPLPTGTGDPEQ